MIRKSKELYSRWKSSKNIKHELDVLLEQANPQAELEQRLIWLVSLLEWIRYTSQPDYKEIQNVKTPTARVKFLLHILDRNPKWKQAFAKTVRSVVQDMSCIEIFSEIGLPEEYSLVSEFKNRFFAKILPDKPLGSSTVQLFTSLFPYTYDIEWLSSLDPLLMKKILDLFNFEISPEEENWNTLENDIEEAIHCLVTDVHARALSPLIRKRLGYELIKEIPFYELAKKNDELFAIFHDSRGDEFHQQSREFRKLIQKCLHSVTNIYQHLNAFGVNVAIVYQLETIQAKLRRADDLVGFLTFEEVDPEMLLYFLVQLAEENQNRKSLSALFNQNTELLSRKIVDRSAETGDHYITRTHSEYVSMFRKAFGGGAYTALTVYLKIFITKIGLTGFFGGFLFSLNYSVSFIAIQLSGFTLATKQPAMTGPALASKLQYLDKGDTLTAFVDEVVNLVRTQMVGILGNMGAVVPVVLILNYFSYFVFGSHLVDEEKAHHILESTNIFGPVILYAAFTGVLLWASSIFAGWLDNWFYFNNMKATIIYNRKFNYIFGKENCMRSARFLEKNISGLAGNISLGFLLGLLPQILSFLSIPLDVRHVTLSSGSLAAAIPVLGWEIFKSHEVYFAMIGIIFTGLLNVSVSFALALYVAIKSRKIKAQHRSHIFKALWRRFCKEPLSFFYLRALNTRKHTDQDSPGADGQNPTGQ